MHRATGEISFVLKSITSPFEIYLPHFSFPASLRCCEAFDLRFDTRAHVEGAMRHVAVSPERVLPNRRNRHQRCRLQVVAGVGHPGFPKFVNVPE